MKNYDWVKEYFAITLGTMFLSVGLFLFLGPNTIAPGGVTGFAIILKKITGIEVFITNLVINIPLFLLGLKLLGKKFGAKTAYGTLMLSFFLFLVGVYFKDIQATNDLLLAAIFGGICNGIGVGLVFRNGGTTGGTDLAGTIANRFIPSLSIPKLMMFFDLMVVITAGVVEHKVETSLYSLIALYVIVKTADFIVEGLDYSKSFYIFTDMPEEISAVILKDLRRGVSAMTVTGMYTGAEKTLLLCVVDRAQAAKVKGIVRSVDPKAFITVTTTHEVLGQGFKNITPQA